MAKVLGIEKVDYVSRQTHRPVSGYRVHVSEEMPSVIGVQVYSEFINGEIPELAEFGDLEGFLGCEVNFNYNRFKRCTGLTLVG